MTVDRGGRSPASGPNGERPAGEPAKRTAECSVLVCDIVDSMSVYTRMGDLRAQELVATCLEALASCVVAQEGRVVKRMGDGLLCVFREIEPSILAGASMFARAADLGLGLHVGVSAGRVVEDDEGDVFGDIVNTAARIAGIAKSGELLVSAGLKPHVPPFLLLFSKEVPAITIKGKDEPLALLAIQLPGSETEQGERVDVDQTITLRGPGEGAAVALDLEHDGRALSLESEGVVTIGRDPDCDVVVSHPAASRLHAKLVAGRGRFELVDSSVNGSLLVQDRSVVRLVRERTYLFGSGAICIGADLADPDGDVIRFETRTEQTEPEVSPSLRRALAARRRAKGRSRKGRV